MNEKVNKTYKASCQTHQEKREKIQVMNIRNQEATSVQIL